MSLSCIHTWDVLLHKTILAEEEAGCPCGGVVLDTTNDLIFVCSFTMQFWRCLGVLREGTPITALHLLNIARVVGDASSEAFVILCRWRLWKQRNAVVFQGFTPFLTAMLKACCDDTVIWRAGMKTTYLSHIDDYLSVLRST
ncbi:hypothetical protein ZWY2020_034163 [Hordeum vulgare]|nr:hypothetical protein ZWY2020_034163 [Hordeum vulgare]